ncbi:putative calcium-binding protein CML45 [Sesbania bispinosa]|nr:putative calcium-binding protein CML45 [Sesbania bispinosa]
MVHHQFTYLIAEQKTSQSDSNSPSPLFGLIELFLYCTFFNKILKFFSSFRFLFFLLCQFQSDNSDIWGEEEVSESEFSHQENDESNRRRESLEIERDEVKMVMAQLGLFCSSESEELDEKYGSKEFSELFEDQEPSFEEVKQAFDVLMRTKMGLLMQGNCREFSAFWD